MSNLGGIRMLKDNGNLRRFNNDHVEMIFSYKVPYGNKYGLSTGNKGGFCTREMYEFENVTEIENLMLGLADMLNQLRCDNGGNLR